MNKTVIAVEFHGFLRDGFYKTFGLRVQANEEVQVGDTVYWKGYQEFHGDGKPLRWEAIPEEGEEHPKRPAVAMEFVSAEEAC